MAMISPMNRWSAASRLLSKQPSVLTYSLFSRHVQLRWGRLNTFASLINQAVEGGAQIISVSQSVSEESPELKWAIANAISKGVIIIASAGNGASDDNVTHLSRFSGVVGVSAINADGTFASYSSWGDGVVTAAFGGPFNTFDPATNQPQTVNGTSVSAPLVAGMLALARQRWPEATTNQILQLLVRTGLNPNHKWGINTPAMVRRLWDRWSTRTRRSTRTRIPSFQSPMALPLVSRRCRTTWTGSQGPR